MGARKKYLQAECSNMGAGFALAARPCTTGWWLFAIHEVDLLAAAQDEGVLHVLLPVPVQQSAQGTATLHMAHKTQPQHIQGLCLCRTTATGGWGSAMASDTSLLPGSIKLLAASSCMQPDLVQVGPPKSTHMLTWFVTRQMALLCWPLRRWCQWLAQALVHPHPAGQLLVPAPLPSPADRLHCWGTCEAHMPPAMRCQM